MAANKEKAPANIDPPRPDEGGAFHWGHPTKREIVQESIQALQRDLKHVTDKRGSKPKKA